MLGLTRSIVTVAAILLGASVTSAAELFDAPSAERDAIERLRHDDAWVRRAIAAERLARYDCPASDEYLQELLRDPHPAVRSYALLNRARRGAGPPAGFATAERDPLVLRTLLRCRHPIPHDRLGALAERLAKSAALDDKLLALELLLASDFPAPRGSEPEALLQTIVFRMGRVETGALSPRLAAITGGSDSGRSYRWREWFRKQRRNLGLNGAYLVDEDPRNRPRGSIAGLPSDRFTELERHLQGLAGRPIELAIVLDCTASMSGELAECQGGIDSLMLFSASVARSVRIGIVAYRDRRDAWETKAWDFTTSLGEARDRLWQLSAEGGGDRPESVSAGLRLAYGRLSWSPPAGDAAPEALRRVVLIGDAPPHPGTGVHCVSYARDGAKRGIRTYAIQPNAPTPSRSRESATDSPETEEATPDLDPMRDPRRWDGPGFAPWWGPPRGRATAGKRPLAPGEVAFFAEIAEAGGGRAVALPSDASLVAEIVGLALGDRFGDELQDFYGSWQRLCR